MLKTKNILHIIAVCALIFFNSCSNEENIVVEENLVISKENFDLLKTIALNDYNRVDFSKVTKPTPQTVNYEKIIEILNNNGVQARSTDFDYSDYENILGEYYDEEYFNQLSALYQYSEEIVKSDLFEDSSTIEQRQEYLEEILTHVILADLNQNSFANRSTNCHAYYDSCSNQAERDHGIRIASCTGGAVILGILTGGAGAATWPVCMATSGFLYESAIQGCSDNLNICLNQ
jgi:hypothetical protein